MDEELAMRLCPRPTSRWRSVPSGVPGVPQGVSTGISALNYFH